MFFEYHQLAFRGVYHYVVYHMLWNADIVYRDVRNNVLI